MACQERVREWAARWAKIFKAIGDVWNRPIYYGGRPRDPVGCCPYCGAGTNAATDRAEYLRRLDAGAEYIRQRDGPDQMTDEELREYMKGALKRLLQREGILD
ncbi:MAG: hypothetical protein JSS54_14100 [Proteobacteria bacterium]|nr:hypothetical protein [Pseudomonadota bacterium]